MRSLIKYKPGWALCAAGLCLASGLWIGTLSSPSKEASVGEVKHEAKSPTLGETYDRLKAAALEDVARLKLEGSNEHD